MRFIIFYACSVLGLYTEGKWNFGYKTCFETQNFNSHDNNFPSKKVSITVNNL